MKIDVLGEKYSVIITNEKKDPRLANIAGFCDDTTKECVIDDGSYAEQDLHSKSNMSVQTKKTIRHEIVHAFLCESGLADCSDWATNEEIVDWIALQGLKFYKAWQEAGAI